MLLSFHGAAGGVTGSCHLVETARSRVLVDCGLFQGGAWGRAANLEPFGFDPLSVDALVLTHAHLDHCGRIPLLVRQGFRGKVVCTAATRELAHMVLLDAARLQEEESERARRHGGRYREPLFDSLDVEQALALFVVDLTYGVSAPLTEDIQVVLQDAGHILGSASVLLKVLEGGEERRVVFSGDLGSPRHPIIRDPVPCPRADFVVMETTYGGHRHRGVSETAKEFFEAVTKTVQRGGNVVVPTFALERAQEVVYGLREGIEHGHVPRDVRVFVDSPMAVHATEIFLRHPECFDHQALCVLESRDPLAFPGLTYVRDRRESKAINEIQKGAVILAGSGMCTGGRVLHHLEWNLPRPECAVVFVGYAASGTPARDMIEGASQVRLSGREVPVKAKIYTINGFSGHGDHKTLMAWHASSGHPWTTFLVHGESNRSLAVRKDLSGKGFHVEVPGLHQVFDV